MTPEFRPAAPADARAILELMAGLYAEDGDVALDRDAALAALGELLAAPSLGRAWVAVAEGAPVAYLVVTWGFSLGHHGRDAFVDEVYVAPPYRGRGLGRRALELAEAACRERGVRALHLEVERANARAERLYRRHGFTGGDRRLMTLTVESG